VPSLNYTFASDCVVFIYDYNGSFLILDENSYKIIIIIIIITFSSFNKNKLEILDGVTYNTYN